VAKLDKTSVYQFSYDLIVGTLDDIRNFAYSHKPSNINVSQHWDFNNDGDMEGWHGDDTHVANESVSNGIYSMNVTADFSGAANLIAPAPLEFNAGTYHHIHIKMRNQTAGTMGYIYWGNNVAGINGQQIVGFPIIPNDTGFTTYNVDMSTSSYWTGTITDLRINPTHESGSVAIDFIYLDNIP
jgi:hypothetical protein